MFRVSLSRKKNKFKQSSLWLTHNHPFHSFRLIYEGIFSFCHPEDDIMTLELDAGGKTVYEEFLDQIAQALNKQWEENIDCQSVSKDDRHVLRVAAVLHVLYDQLKKRLQRLPVSPPPTVVRRDTLTQAINLIQYFTGQRKVLDQVSEIYAYFPAFFGHCYSLFGWIPVLFLSSYLFITGVD